MLHFGEHCAIFLGITVRSADIISPHKGMFVKIRLGKVIRHTFFRVTLVDFGVKPLIQVLNEDSSTCLSAFCANHGLKVRCLIMMVVVLSSL